MFTGHAALAVVAKVNRPAVPIGILLAASYFADIVDIGLRTLGVARAIDISHSLVTIALAAILAGVLYWLVRRDAGGGIMVTAVYLSHWPADYLTGLYKPLWPGGPHYGLGLYHMPLFDFAMEGALLVSLYFIARRYIRPYFIVMLLIVQLLFNVGIATEHPGLKRQLLDGLSSGEHFRERLTRVIGSRMALAPGGGDTNRARDG